MSSENEKGEIEKNIFQDFLKRSGLPINPDTVEKRAPPEPDILCQRADGTFVAIELVEICDSNLAKAISRADSHYIRTTDPSQDVIERKLTKNYTAQHDIELLCYLGGRVVTPDDCVIPNITPLFQNGDHVFKRVWLLGNKGIYLIWETS